MWFYSFLIQSMKKKPDELSLYTFTHLFIHVQQLILLSQLAPRTWIISPSLLPMLLSSEEIWRLFRHKESLTPSSILLQPLCLCRSVLWNSSRANFWSKRIREMTVVLMCASTSDLKDSLCSVFICAQHLPHTHTHIDDRHTHLSGNCPGTEWSLRV